MPTMSHEEVDLIERSFGVPLPNLWRRLLIQVGPGAIGSTAELYHPLRARELFEPFFDDPAQLFHPYFPFGCHNHKQEIWVIDAMAERAASIWHETVPDDWPDERWLDYDEWVRRHWDEVFTT